MVWGGGGCCSKGEMIMYSTVPNDVHVKLVVCHLEIRGHSPPAVCLSSGD